MTDSRDTGAPPIKVTTAEEYDQHYMPYEVMPERDVGTMLKRVEEVLRHADRVFEYNQALFTSTDYAVLTSKYQNYLAELAEEKRLRQKPIDDIVAQSPILSVLYAIKERGLDRATALLRNVELFQSEILQSSRRAYRNHRDPLIFSQAKSLVQNRWKREGPSPPPILNSLPRLLVPDLVQLDLQQSPLVHIAAK
ncbi:hypothetical protein FRC10_008691 [Ceratobasidium sp. 414]|nr:hypothetical protein FRC10_008691 [Ceratobasidium sp. 414]